MVTTKPEWVTTKPEWRDVNFSTALHHLKNGAVIARSGWNGKGMFLFLVTTWEFEVAVESAPGRHLDPVNVVSAPFIAMKTADGKIVPWLASQTDILADDWVVLGSKRD